MGEKLLCGVDLGGTKLSVGLFTAEGKSLIERRMEDHSHLGNKDMVSCVAKLIHSLGRELGVPSDEVQSIGVGIAGHINSREGLIITSSNFPIPFRNYPFKKELEHLVDVPVTLDNDANAQVLGECLFGAGQNRRNVVFITVSTGVGAGIIAGGKIFRGHFGFSGEIGHTIVEASSPIRCTCGNRGCLMALCGTLGLAERYEVYLREGRKSKLGFREGKVPRIDGMLLKEGVKLGDDISLRLLRESADYVGLGIYNIYQVINPQTVILGGGLMKLESRFFDLVCGKFKSLVRNMVYEDMEIVPAELGGRAGLLGAVFLPGEIEEEV